MKTENVLTRSRNISRDSYLWNMAGSGIMAFQSVLLLMILTRTVGLKYSGIFTIAYANANLMLTIGKYYMHNFHVSDTAELYSFGDYRLSRIITTVLMLLCSAGYVIIYALQGNSSQEKSMIILFTCIFKAVDAIEDVYCSLYQQRGRLDISGKVMTLRLIVTLLFFTLCILVTRDLLITLIASTVFTAVVCLGLNLLCFPYFRAHVQNRGNLRQVARLLGVCLPLFVGNFLSLYLTNAPKYAIDRMLSDEEQACYGFIAMPMFVINLLNNFIFNPVIRSMSEKWAQKDISWIRRALLRQILIIIGICVVCLAGAAVLGIPVLSLLYGTNLHAYRAELLVLLVGSGFLAISGMLLTVITIMRQQKASLAGYGICAVLAFFLASPAVNRWGMMGAAMLSMLLHAILSILFALIVIFRLRQADKYPNKGDNP